MKNKLILASFMSCFLLSFSYASDIDDDSIIKELSNENTQEISAEAFQMKKFESCESLEKVTSDFLKDYHKKYPPYYRGGGIMLKNAVLEDMSFAESDSVDMAESKSAVAGEGGGDDFSGTNEQVVGVSESEIVKTDGKYIYYMSDYYDNSLKTANYQDRQKKNVFVVDAKNMQVVKKIALPKHFWGTQLYLQNDKLVILASGRPSGKFQSQFWDNSSKTYTIIYDVSDPKNAQLSKVFMTEGNFSKSRLIGDKLYVISSKDSYSFFRAYDEKNTLDAEDIIPKGLELIHTSDEAQKNVEINGEKRDYKVNTGYVSKCSEVEYILPDSDSDLGYPQFNMVSIINIDDLEKSAQTKLIFGNINEIYMSLDNLYITNSVYKSKAFRCGAGMRCISPFYYGGTNHTLIHKMNVSGDTLNYQTSALVEGSPLTQYSMDEYKDDFRILTKTNRWNSDGQEAHTDLYVLDKDLELKSSLQNLGKGEEFKSSRYIGEKLFLVTFEQVDPLFVIDLADPKNPEILGELKIPGYSTYLHPYDETHLVGIGYDTTQNEWGGVQNTGVKVDLYEMNYDKTCDSDGLTQDEIDKCDSGDYKGIIVKQKYTKTFGGYGSSSEALYNPRMFMWKADEKQLLLPMTLKQSDPKDKYRSIDFFQGLVSLRVDDQKGISQDYQITHIDLSDIEEQRTKTCEKYSDNGDEEQECVKLIGGGEYCTSKKKTYSYVPKYCYEDSPIGEYLASNSWNYSKDFVKRAIWIGDDVYTISNTGIQKSDLETGVEETYIEMK